MKISSRMQQLKPSDIRVVMKLIAENPGTISLASGSPDPSLFPVEAFREINAQILQENPSVALQYGMTLGRMPLRERIALEMSRIGKNTKPTQIMVTTGSQQGLSLAAQLFCDKDDTIVTENPSYLGALSAFKPFGVQCVGIDGDEDGMDMEALDAYIQAHENIRMLYVVPNFQNPTGKTWSLERRKKLLRIASKYDLPIVEDDAYGRLRYEGEFLPSLFDIDTDGRVVYLGSFSKILSPGLRVGWIATSEKMITQLEMLKYGADLQSVEISQMMVESFFDKYDIDAHLETIRSSYRSRRDAMIHAIEQYFPEEASYIYPEGGMFVWVTLPESIDCRQLLEEAVKRKVAFVPGTSFYPSEDIHHTCRLNFSAMNEEKIIQGIQILGECISEFLD